jgi:hypothetical protein
MNKELIKRYLNEFMHWLNGGSLCIYRTDTKQFWEPTTIFNWDPENPETVVYIINDEYVEFRKALTEGKTIQIYDVIKQHISNPNLDKYGWRDFKSFTQSSAFSKSVGSYRIKPEEPQFKVGDWITNHGKLVGCVTKTDTEFVYFKPINKDSEGSLYLLKDDKQFDNNIELWQPKPNEWCWFWEHNSDTYADIAQFKELYKDKFKSTNMIWNYCAPFIGELPPHLKD